MDVQVSHDRAWLLLVVLSLSLAGCGAEAASEAGSAADSGAAEVATAMPSAAGRGGSTAAGETKPRGATAGTLASMSGLATAGGQAKPMARDMAQANAGGAGGQAGANATGAQQAQPTAAKSMQTAGAGGATLPQGGAIAPGTAGVGGMMGGTTMPADDGAVVAGPVRWLGRVDDRDPSAARFSWAGAGLAAVVQGTTLAVRLKNENDSVWYQAVIDGEPKARVEVPEGEHVVTLASGLNDGPHRVELYRDTEGDGAVSVFLGFEKGSLVGSPQPSGRFFEIVGDSITVGFGNLGMERHDVSSPGCGGTHKTSSWFMTYEAIAARELNAEVSAIARSGFGMYRGYGQNMSVMPPLFDDTLADENDPPWSFARQPAALIINLGTNDWNGGDPGTPYETAYIKFVTEVRSRYPDAWILLTIGSTLEDGRKRQVVARLERVVDARKRAGDDKLAVIDVGIQETAVTGCAWHPSAAEHMRMGTLLSEELRTRLGWN